MFVIVGFCVLFSPSLSAQGLSFGLKGGLNIANLRGEDVTVDMDSRIGLCAGGFVAIDVLGIITIQPEVLFSMKGAKYDTLLFGEPVSTSLEFNYIEIPVLVKYSLPLPGIIKPNLFIGPSLGINLNAKAIAKIGDLSVEDDVKEDIKSTDFCLVLGGGVDFELDIGKLAIDVRYTMGLTTIDDTAVEEDVKNGVISIMAAYSF